MTGRQKDTDRILDVRDLVVRFATENGQVTAVDGVSLHLDAGEILGVVGESGCGKSVTAQAVLRLFDEKTVTYTGETLFQGDNLLDKSAAEMTAVRGGSIGMIFQDPSASIDPVFTIGDQIAETIRAHRNVPRRAAFNQAVDLLRATGIPSPEQRAGEYPHELSGGMKQRAMIAMALAGSPELLIADEPTTALDVTIQAQIIELLRQINADRAMGILMITHDLGVVADMCSRVLVMYLGQVVEMASVEALFNAPRHPYTKGLFKAIPRLDSNRDEDLFTIPGTVPSLRDVPPGCRFAPRCGFADGLCKSEMPALTQLPDGSQVRCWHHDRIGRNERKSDAS